MSPFPPTHPLLDVLAGRALTGSPQTCARTHRPLQPQTWTSAPGWSPWQALSVLVLPLWEWGYCGGWRCYFSDSTFPSLQLVQSWSTAARARHLGRNLSATSESTQAWQGSHSFSGNVPEFCTTAQSPLLPAALSCRWASQKHIAAYFRPVRCRQALNPYTAAPSFCTERYSVTLIFCGSSSSSGSVLYPCHWAPYTPIKRGSGTPHPPWELA